MEVAKTGSGGTPTSTRIKYYENGNIPWINSGEVNQPVIVNTNNFISNLGLANSSAKLFPINTILVAMYGATAGKVSLLRIEASTNQAICAVIPNSESYLFLVKLGAFQIFAWLSCISEVGFSQLNDLVPLLVHVKDAQVEHMLCSLFAPSLSR